MKTNHRWAMLTVAGMTLLSLSTLARADIIPAVDYSGGVTTTVPGNFALGFQFKVGSLDYEVTAVGLYAGIPPAGQTVRIYQDGTTTNTLLQAVSASDPLSGSGTYRYADLATPVLLQANTTYNLVVDYFPGDNIRLVASAFSNDPDINYVQSIGDVGVGIFPTADNVHLGAYVSGTFQGQTVMGAVPEPSSIVLLATIAGLLCLMFHKRRQSRDRTV